MVVLCIVAVFTRYPYKHLSYIFGGVATAIWMLWMAVVTISDPPEARPARKAPVQRPAA